MIFIVTTHQHLRGVFLSRPGHFGNVPFQDETAALAHARELAGKVPISVQRETGGRRVISH